MQPHGVSPPTGLSFGGTAGQCVTYVVPSVTTLVPSPRRKPSNRKMGNLADSAPRHTEPCVACSPSGPLHTTRVGKVKWPSKQCFSDSPPPGQAMTGRLDKSRARHHHVLRTKYRRTPSTLHPPPRIYVAPHRLTSHPIGCSHVKHTRNPSLRVSSTPLGLLGSRQRHANLQFGNEP